MFSVVILPADHIFFFFFNENILSYQRNQPNYMQPKVVVRLQLVPGSNPNLQCTAWNGNINVVQLSGYGYVPFSVQVCLLSFFFSFFKSLFLTLVSLTIYA
jgi:hypothetical protein